MPASASAHPAGDSFPHLRERDLPFRENLICGQWPAPATTSSKIQTLLATFPGPWGCLLTQDSQRPMLVMGRPLVLTFVQRGFEDSTALR